MRLRQVRGLSKLRNVIREGDTQVRVLTYLDQNTSSGEGIIWDLNVLLV